MTITTTTTATATSSTIRWHGGGDVGQQEQGNEVSEVQLAEREVVTKTRELSGRIRKDPKDIGGYE